MTPTQLRNSILQAAITGCLVPQTESDGTAEQLLQQIEDEKRRLIDERNAARIAAARAAGKSDAEIKKLKLEKYTAPKPVNPEDAPFEIPKSWRWVRLGDVFMHSSGKQLSGTNANSKGTFHKYITTSNLYWGRFELDNLKQMKFTDEELERCTATYGDLLVCEGGDIGRSAIWNYDYDICLQNHVHKLRPYFSDYTLYIFYVMMYYKGVNMIGGKGIGIQGLSANALKNIFLPLPPLSEQHRIVSKLEELLPLVEEYGSAQGELDALNAALPDKLKKSLLQQAITGNLVAQDPAEGTAEQLLQQIEDEKRRLINERNAAKIAAARAAGKSDAEIKKIKLEKYTAPKPVNPEDFPFEIPESWRWVRIGDIFETSSGGTPTSSNKSYYGGDILWVRSGELSQKYIYDTEIKITEEGLNNSSAKCFDVDTVCIALYGATVGQVAILKVKATTNQAVCGIFPIKGIEPEYLRYFLVSQRKNFMAMASGGAQPNISQDKVKNTLLPLPPLAEQRRIVAKLEEMFEEIDRLK